MKLRLLLLEDSIPDAELVLRELRKSGYELDFEQVCSRPDFTQALGKGGWDLILSDFNMPGFNAFDALRILELREADTPVIVVSGAVGEETAVELIKAGAGDFVTKSNLTRLPAAVRHALKELEDTRFRKEVERADRVLAQATTHLSASLDYSETANAVARMALPEFCDGAVVDVWEKGIATRAVAHIDQSMAARLSEIGLRRLDSESSPVAKAVQQAHAWRMRGELLAQFFPRAVEELGVASAIVAPLQSRSRLFGAIYFVARSAEIFSERDLALAEELGRRASFAIDNALLYRKAEDAIRDRDDMLARVSHDLKNPLTSIELTSALALKALTDGEDLPEAMGGAFERISRSTEQMKNLIRDLLDLSRIEAGRLVLDRKACTMFELLRDVLDLLTPIAESKSIHLADELKPLAGITGAWDGERIIHVFSNIVGNALKFAADGGRVTVRGEREGNSVYVTVTDSGPGIPAEDLKYIFDRYWQARKTARHGTGLGLSIAKGIIDAHDGKIWVDSEIGKGTKVHVTLPI